MTKKELLELIDKYVEYDTTEIELFVQEENDRQALYIFSVERELEEEDKIIFNLFKV